MSNIVFDRQIIRLVALCRELDMEMDGVKCPAAAAAILNAIRGVLEELEGDV